MKLGVTIPLVLALSALSSASGATDRDDTRICPYCHHDPELMAAAGIVSHGGFEFGEKDTAAVEELLAVSDLYWIESAHFEIGLDLGSYRPKQYERKKIRAELERLASVLPDVNPKARSIDPWLRAHLYAQRVEDMWKRFLEILDFDAAEAEAAFPEGTTPWDLKGKYMGEGPHLGQKGKYEILILANEKASIIFRLEHFGLVTTITQRWNIPLRSTLHLLIHTEQGQLNVDAALHGHVVFNLTHNLIDGFKFYAYDTPVWLHEGLAHYIERDLNPRFNTFDSGEGAVAEMTRKSDWITAVKRLIQTGKDPNMAQLVNLKSYAELELPHHYTTWSKVAFLIETQPRAFAQFLDSIKGMTTAEGFSDGSELRDVQRTKIKELFGFSYAQLDEAWRQWALAREP